LKPSERRKARHCATQAIYQWQMTKANVGDIEEQFKIAAGRSGHGGQGDPASGDL